MTGRPGGRRSRNKGAVAERELAAVLSQLGYPTQRAARNGVDAGEDLVGGLPGTHIECKRTERIAIHAAMAQAIASCPVNLVPMVCHRRNRGEWMATIHLSDLVFLLKSRDGQR